MTEGLLPLRRAFEVRCSVEHAFDTWTRRVNLWWPRREHSVSRNEAAFVAIECWHGGRLFETTRSGDEIAWGTVNTWQPPNRFGYLWFIGENDATEATQVTITFTALESGRTLVAIEHSGWEAAGAKAASRRLGNERGWMGLEGVFVEFVNSERLISKTPLQPDPLPMVLKTLSGCPEDEPLVETVHLPVDPAKTVEFVRLLDDLIAAMRKAPGLREARAFPPVPGWKEYLIYEVWNGPAGLRQWWEGDLLREFQAALEERQLLTARPSLHFNRARMEARP